MERTTTEEHPFGRHMLKTPQAATLLGLSARTLEDLRLKGTGPRFVRMSARCIRYRPADVSDWVESRVVSSTSDPGASDGD